MATSKSKTKPSSEGAATQKPRRTASKASSATTPESPSPKRARTPKAASAAAPVPTPSAPEPDTFQPQQAAPIHASERHRYVQEAAYFRAERRGFVPGFEHEDWLQAEAEVDARLHGQA